MKKKTEAVISALCCVMLVLLLVINMAVSTFFHYYSIVAVTGEVDYSDVTVSYSDEESVDLSDVKIELPEESVFYSKDVMNILLIGTDERTELFNKASRSDTMMLISLNKKTHDVKLVSFERDTYVSLPNRPPQKLCHAFQFGGAKLVMNTLQSHFSLDVEKYVRVNFFVFTKLVDEVGGVDIDLTEAEANIIADRTNQITKKGLNHLDGSAALCYSRIRVIDSDWERVKRQQNVIISIKNSLKQQSPSQINKILNNCLPYVQTNLSASECAYLLFNVKDYSEGNVERMTLPDFSTFRKLEHVDFKTNARLLREFLYGE